MSTFLIRSSTSQSTSFLVVLARLSRPNSLLKLWKYRESNSQPHETNQYKTQNIFPSTLWIVRKYRSYFSGTSLYSYGNWSVNKVKYVEIPDLWHHAYWTWGCSRWVRHRVCPRHHFLLLLSRSTGVELQAITHMLTTLIYTKLASRFKLISSLVYYFSLLLN